MGILWFVNLVCGWHAHVMCGCACCLLIEIYLIIVSIHKEILSSFVLSVYVVHHINMISEGTICGLHILLMKEGVGGGGGDM